ncbi:craniofacial development protein 2-like [Aricia agestis]|uniref:craniofacial development protein 2-like n=1 Tax=Aricia agestis TaxID=91739 RepID=UPI001C2056C8|nr:craniofacial development protein 2-like [Aricia agestis]
MRREGEGIEERSEYIMYHHGNSSFNGVGFLVKSKYKNTILNFTGISDRLAILRMQIPNNKKELTIIQVYAPTQQARSSEMDEFYNVLSVEAKKYAETNLIIMGDFNAQIGPKQAGEDHIIGRFGHGKRSINGHKLVDFLLENNLTLLNSVFKKKHKNKWTWISPDGRTKNEIDFTLSNIPKNFADTGVIQNFNFNTNHRMVRGCLSVSGFKSLDKIQS